MTNKSQNAKFFFSSGKVRARVMVFGDNINSIPIIFVAGWASSFSTWRFVIPKLQEYGQIYYFETREKPFTIRSEKHSPLDIDAMSSDLSNFINENFSEDFLLIGASVGASTIINAYKHINKKPKALVLITPNNTISLPKFFFILNILPIGLFNFIRPMILKWISWFSYAKDGHKVQGLISAMSIAELDIVRKSATALNRMDLTKIDLNVFIIPVLIVAALDDGMHSPNDANYFHKKINGSSIKVFKSFTEVHSTKCANEIISWFKNQIK